MEGEPLRTSRGRGGKRFKEPREPPGRETILSSDRGWFDEGVVRTANVGVEESYGVISNERATDRWQSRRGRRRRRVSAAKIGYVLGGVE